MFLQVRPQHAHQMAVGDFLCRASLARQADTVFVGFFIAFFVPLKSVLCIAALVACAGWSFSHLMFRESAELGAWMGSGSS